MRRLVAVVHHDRAAVEDEDVFDKADDGEQGAEEDSQQHQSLAVDESEDTVCQSELCGPHLHQWRGGGGGGGNRGGENFTVRGLKLTICSDLITNNICTS